MVDSQRGLLMLAPENQTARTAGLLVIGAVIGLVLMRRFNIAGSVSAG
jgi:hypothetical protein